MVIKRSRVVFFRVLFYNEMILLVRMKKKITKPAGNSGQPGDTGLFRSISQLIEQSRQRVLITINTELVNLYWNIGNTIRKNVLLNKRAEYGEQVIAVLSRRLATIYGTGWSEKQLNHCLRSAEIFTKKQIVSAVRRQLSWTHLKTIMYLPDDLQRGFYFEMCILERWSTRQLQERIDSLLYERTAISKKPGGVIKKELEALRTTEKVTPDLIFRDPYF